MDIRFSLATLPLISGNLNALAIKVAPSEYSAHLLLCCRAAFNTKLGGFLFSFRILNLNNAGDSAVERERDAWIEVDLMQFC